MGGFADFIKGAFYRNQLQRSLDRWNNLQPPKNPSRRTIDRIVLGLLKDRTARESHKMLSMMGEVIVPSLAAVVNDPRFHQAE